ncbi:hypothetical protein [Sphaerisporangium corydalis]|uniref:DUF5666 domain-containing protein n=1 Tax=Sphaerisporangium corydalis TaxID=1441875 RepID=A0ABV9ETV2_9ACTN|nr:hypothetical protein [Sphaerisporangium corydalis]
MTRSRRKPYAKDDPVTAQDLLETSPFDGDLDAELAVRPDGRRTSTLTLVLGAGVVLVVGMLMGIQAHKAFGSSTGGRQGLQSALAGNGGQRAGGLRGGYPGGGQGLGQGQGGQGQGGQGGQGGGGGGAFGNVTVGTIKLVDGGKIYLETAGGGVVTIKTTGDTKVQVSKEGKVKDLKPGSSIIVQGERAADGTISATSVNQGGLGGFGNRGGG